MCIRDRARAVRLDAKGDPSAPSAMAAVPIPTAAKSGRVYGYKAERVAISVQDAAFMIEKRLATTRFVKHIGESTGESRNRGGESDCHNYDKLLSRDQHLSLDG